MKKRFFILLFILISINSLYAVDDVSLYINGLESIVNNNDTRAKESFNQLIDTFPNSKYNIKASDLLYDLNTKVDNSGIVPFYLGNISTFTYTSFGLLNLLNVSADPIITGLAGLAGVGSGIGGSYLLSKDDPISFELYSRIFSTQAVAMGNFYYAQELLYDLNFIGNTTTEDKVMLGSQLATLNGSLFLSYFGYKDTELEQGKGLFGLQSYAWATYYYWLSNLIFDINNDTTRLGLAMAITDVAYLGSLKLWDQLQWSSARSGLVSVGGIGGALIGLFTNLIIGDLVSLETKTYTSIVLGCTLAGQAITTYLTRDFDEHNSSLTAQNNMIMPYPIIKANNEFGVGFHMFI